MGQGADPMTGDSFYPFIDRSLRVVAGVVITTETCQKAQNCHRMAGISALCMARLLSATALASCIQDSGPMSLQVLGDGHLGQAYADITQEGAMRGYVKNPTLAFAQGTDFRQRLRVGPALGQGSLSVIRLGQGREFAQSTTDLLSGEIDADVEHFMGASEQVPTALYCDALLGDKQVLSAAGGLIIQAMPDADTGTIKKIKQDIKQIMQDKASLLATDPATIVQTLLPNAQASASPRPLLWKCRCSQERANAGLAMLGAKELAAMVDANEPASISCDFCNTTYHVEPNMIEQVFLSTITAKG
jgi:molecular chaperone Hsp33